MFFGFCFFQVGQVLLDFTMVTGFRDPTSLSRNLVSPMSSAKSRSLQVSGQRKSAPALYQRNYRWPYLQMNFHRKWQDLGTEMGTEM
jgi:hypothetical protein